MAIAAYNGGPGKISHYCGTEKIKKQCGSVEDNWVPEYIPSSARFGMAYVSDVVKQIPQETERINILLANKAV